MKMRQKQKSEKEWKDDDILNCFNLCNRFIILQKKKSIFLHFYGMFGLNGFSSFVWFCFVCKK